MMKADVAQYLGVDSSEGSLLQHSCRTWRSRSEPGAVGTWDEPCGSAMLNVDGLVAATRGQGIAA